MIEISYLGVSPLQLTNQQPPYAVLPSLREVKNFRGNLVMPHLIIQGIQSGYSFKINVEGIPQKVYARLLTVFNLA